MAERYFRDWLPAYIEYASYSEAPRIMHFFAGVAAVAGALRRKVWIDQHYFRWTPNFFIIFVAPPGVVSKSSTVDIAMDLLRAVPGIRFGPDIVTWPALVAAFEAASEAFLHNKAWVTMSPITLVASELGNLLNPGDREAVDLMITLWDGKKKIEKVTKGSGSNIIEAPWINLIGCTTPSWISENIPAAMIGGGFTSRCLFLYAEKKEKLVAYPKFSIPKDILEIRRMLVHDLEYLAMNLVGEYELTPDAVAWGEAWYSKLWSVRPAGLEDERFSGYLARKQTHMHKLAIVLAASQRDTLRIEMDDLIISDRMLTTLEGDMQQVFSSIGKGEDSIQVDRLIMFIQQKGLVSYQEAYRLIHSYFPNLHDFEDLIAGAIKAGYVELVQQGTVFMLKATSKSPAVIVPFRPADSR